MTIEICIWKEIAEKDLNKPDALKTLDPNKECNKDCKSYYIMQNDYSPLFPVEL